MGRYFRTDEKVARIVEAHKEVISELGKSATRVTQKYIFELVTEKDGVFCSWQHAQRIMYKHNRDLKIKVATT